MTPAALEQLFWVIAAVAASVLAVLVWCVVLLEALHQYRGRPRLSEQENARLAAAAHALRQEYERGGQLGESEVHSATTH